MGDVRIETVQGNCNDRYDNPHCGQDGKEPPDDHATHITRPHEDDCEWHEDHPLEGIHDQPPNRLCLAEATGSSSS